VLTLTAAGSVSDYEDTSRLQQSVAIAAGVDTSLVTINVAAASVIITATIGVPASTTAAAVQASLSSTLGIAAEPSTAPSTALGVRILAVPTITIADSTGGDAVGHAPPSTPLWTPHPPRPRMLPSPPPTPPPLLSRPSVARAADNSTLPTANAETSEVIIGATVGALCAVVALCGCTACFCRTSFCFARSRDGSQPRLRLFTVGPSAPAAAPPPLSVRSKRKTTAPPREVVNPGALTAHGSQHGDDPEKPPAAYHITHHGIAPCPSDLNQRAPAQIADPGTTEPDGWDGEGDGGSESPHAFQTQQAWLEAEISIGVDDGEADIKNSSDGYRMFSLQV
jgi:hypothetical protein